MLAVHLFSAYKTRIHITLLGIVGFWKSCLRGKSWILISRVELV